MNQLIKQLIENRLFISTKGTSMLPLLYDNDYIFLKKISFYNINTDDIISFTNGKRTITHRVIYKTKKYFITKGNNNPESDGKIYPRQIIGKVIKVKRDGKEFDPNQIYLFQSSLYFQEIVKIKNTFEKEKIDYVILKGLPLHLYYEKLHPKRIYADCDVLIKKEHFFKAERMIKKFGYRKTDEKNKQVENNYYKTISGFPVIFDIHLEPAFLMSQFSGLEALYPQKLINKLTEELLNNKQQIKINDELFFILNTKYLILYLALHLFHHNFRGAFRYQFLDTVIRKNRLSTNDWQKIALIINNYQLGNFVYPVFVLLKKYYQTPIPKEFFKTIKPSDFINFMNFINFKNLNIFDDESRLHAGINRFKNIFFLSPYPLWRKIFVFTNPSVIYFIFWALWRKLSSFFSNRLGAH